MPIKRAASIALNEASGSVGGAATTDWGDGQQFGRLAREVSAGAAGAMRPCARNARRRRRWPARAPSPQVPLARTFSANPAERQQFGAEGNRYGVKARIALFAGEIIDGVLHFDGIAGGAGQGLVHIGDQRRPSAGRRPVGHHSQALRQVARSRKAGHESPRPCLDVHRQTLQASRQFLRQDRGGDQRDRFDGCR